MDSKHVMPQLQSHYNRISFVEKKVDGGFFRMDKNFAEVNKKLEVIDFSVLK